MYCFYSVNTFSQEKRIIQQCKILYMSKDQGILFCCVEFPKTGGRLKVWKLNIISATTALKIPLPSLSRSAKLSTVAQTTSKALAMVSLVAQFESEIT